MAALSALDQKMKEAVLDISIKHLLRYKQKSPQKIAEHILLLCMDSLSAEKAQRFIEELLVLFLTSDDSGIRIWIHQQLTSSK